MSNIQWINEQTKRCRNDSELTTNNNNSNNKKQKTQPTFETIPAILPPAPLSPAPLLPAPLPPSPNETIENQAINEFIQPTPNYNNYDDSDQDDLIFIESLPPNQTTRILHLYFQQDVDVRLKWFPGCSRNELKESIREVLGIGENLPLRFRDADGDLVALTTSIPTNTKLFVSVESGAANRSSQVVTQSRTVNRSSRVVNPSPLTVNRSSLTLNQSRQNTFRWEFFKEGQVSAFSYEKESGGEYFYVISVPLPTTHIQYYVFSFPERWCCCSIGLVESHVASLGPDRPFQSPQYPYMLILKCIGKGPQHKTGSGKADGMDIGIYYDPNAKIAIFVDDKDPSSPTKAIRLENLKSPLRLAVHGAKHGVKLKVSQKEPPSNIYQGQAALYSRFQHINAKENQKEPSNISQQSFAASSSTN